MSIDEKLYRTCAMMTKLITKKGNGQNEIAERQYKSKKYEEIAEKLEGRIFS